MHFLAILLAAISGIACLSNLANAELFSIEAMQLAIIGITSLSALVGAEPIPMRALQLAARQEGGMANNQPPQLCCWPGCGFCFSDVFCYDQYKCFSGFLTSCCATEMANGKRNEDGTFQAYNQAGNIIRYMSEDEGFEIHHRLASEVTGPQDIKAIDSQVIGRLLAEVRDTKNHGQ